MARPTLYKPEYAKQAGKLCSLGATDAMLADFFEVTVSTINLWKIKHPEFSESIKEYKQVADDHIERSLYQRAMGYEHDEVDLRVIQNEVIATPIRKFYPPDTTAAIFWLKNRKPKEWRETKAVELTGAEGGPLQTETKLNVSALSTQALAEIMALKDATDKE